MFLRLFDAIEVLLHTLLHSRVPTLIPPLLRQFPPQGVVDRTPNRDPSQAGLQLWRGPAASVAEEPGRHVDEVFCIRCGQHDARCNWSFFMPGAAFWSHSRGGRRLTSPRSPFKRRGTNVPLLVGGFTSLLPTLVFGRTVFTTKPGPCSSTTFHAAPSASTLLAA